MDNIIHKLKKLEVHSDDPFCFDVLKSNPLVEVKITTYKALAF